MQVLYYRANDSLSEIDGAALAATSERHKVDLAVPASGVEADPISVLRDNRELQGIVLEMARGYPGRDRLAMAKDALRLSRRVWLHWPRETAVECVDAERLASHWRHYFFINAYRTWRRGLNALARARYLAGAFVGVARERGLRAASAQAAQELARILARPAAAPRPADQRLAELARLIASAAPAPWPHDAWQPSPEQPVAGTGVYLRTDWWARIESGGSYGHTCYVAKELAAVTEQFVCFMPHRYRLLDAYGLRQVVLQPRSETETEDEIVTATPHYLALLKPAFEALRPAYVYERLVLGSYVGATLCRDLGIPYIVEYNGSEISMRRSFDGTGYVHEADYLKAEEFAFRQATMISVISDEVRAGLVARGVDAAKILVNPNGADPVAYAPPLPDEQRAVRAELGLPETGPVVGFTGTFGGWHGVDVLAAALPLICERAPAASFLLIGDGNYKHLIDQAVAAHGLSERVRMTGRTTQSEGARLLKACDIFVSPHNTHMVDSKFFGSPTKIFEYMAMAGGIVASDLEQIGESLSPGITAADLADPALTVRDERSVLCTPGDVGEFVDAVVRLAARPEISAALGRNARQALLDHYSWARHVSHLWPFMAGKTDGAVVTKRRRARPEPPRALQQPSIETGDRYKDEVQRQWDNDPAGSHYVKDAPAHTLEWFKEVEAYRYDEYAPWMAETMEFARHAGHDLLEIGGGIGTDLSQFAAHGARITDCDLSSGHLELAKENFRLRGLPGRFVHQDAETLPFEDASFDVVYSNGVLHHTPNTRRVVEEIDRVLRPGGRAIIMMYAENSLHYWRNLVYAIGLKERMLDQWSMGEIMSRSVERSDNAAARPLVKVYTKRRLAALFDGFADIDIVQRQMVAAEVPRLLRLVPLPSLGRWMGWNVIIKARKPAATR